MPNQIITKAGGNLFNQILTEAAGSNFKSLPTHEELAKFKKIFDDEDLVATCFCLFENDLNVSRTAQKLYMHRNTLIYRLAKLKRITSLSVTDFSDAITFMICYHCYAYGRGTEN